VQLPGKKCNHHFDRKRSSVPPKNQLSSFPKKRVPIDKVSIEEVGLAFARQSVQLEDIQQVVILSVDISANGQSVLTDSGLPKVYSSLENSRDVFFHN
jgi:Ni2+-binding GTPase involved in maturation of urease and hydrogenase